MVLILGPTKFWPITASSDGFLLPVVALGLFDIIIVAFLLLLAPLFRILWAPVLTPWVLLGSEG